MCMFLNSPFLTWSELGKLSGNPCLLPISSRCKAGNIRDRLLMCVPHFPTTVPWHQVSSPKCLVDNRWKHGVKLLHDWKNASKRCEFFWFYLYLCHVLLRFMLAFNCNTKISEKSDMTKSWALGFAACHKQELFVAQELINKVKIKVLRNLGRILLTLKRNNNYGKNKIFATWDWYHRHAPKAKVCWDSFPAESYKASAARKLRVQYLRLQRAWQSVWWRGASAGYQARGHTDTWWCHHCRYEGETGQG